MATPARGASGAQEMIEWIKERIDLPGIQNAKWKDEYDITLINFLSHPNTHHLFIYTEEQSRSTKAGAFQSKLADMEEEDGEFDDEAKETVELSTTSSTSVVIRFVTSITALKDSKLPQFNRGHTIGDLQRTMSSASLGTSSLYGGQNGGNNQSPIVVLPADFMYFVRPEGVTLTLDTMVHRVKYGRIRGDNATTSLLRVMTGLYSREFQDNSSWPESVKRDFTGQLHKFMASLTEITHQAKGKTVLYIPVEDVSQAAVAAKDKDLVQRLETIVIRWTRQIKEVVNNQDMAQNTETSGPIEEIQFWRSRTQDLSGISEQLQQEGVLRIVAVLEIAKSSYLGPFLTIVDMIQRGSNEANDNLKFLMSLQEPCTKLELAAPDEIPTILPNLLDCIRMIWSISKYYNTEERLTGLLRKVSNQIITCCCSKITLDGIFEKDVIGSMISLNQSIEAGVSWKRLYQRCADSIAMFCKDPARHWNFDIASIFAQVDAFVQRCRDLLEVCEGQIQFARKGVPNAAEFQHLPPTTTKNGIQAIPQQQQQQQRSSSKTHCVMQSGCLPAFGGVRGPEITKQLVEIQEEFSKHIIRLRELDYDILDVKATRWHDDYNYLKNGMKDLEVMMQNVINSAFDGVNTIELGVQLLDAFTILANREAIKRCVVKKTSEVYTMMIKEIEVVRHEFDTLRNNPPLGKHSPKYAGAASWTRNLLNRIKSKWTLLENAKFLKPTREAEEAAVAYEQLCLVFEDFTMRMYQDWMGDMQGLDQAQMQQRLEIPLMIRASVAEQNEAGSDDISGDLNSAEATETNKNNQVSAESESKAGNATGPSSNAPNNASGKTPEVHGKAGEGSNGPNDQTQASEGGTKQMSTQQQTQLLRFQKREQPMHLLCNFDKRLTRLFAEVHTWETFQGDVQIPYVAHDVTNKDEELRVLREHVMLVVRDYNKIIDTLLPTERRLFQEHIRRLDRRIAPGLSKLTWASKGVIDWYVRECRRHCADAYRIVDEFKAKNEIIKQQCKRIAATMLLSLEKNTVYNENVFVARQKQHREVVGKTLKETHEAIQVVMNEMYEHFKSDPADVQQEWKQFVSSVDKMLADSLKHAVRRSLQELSRAINGDAKTEPTPLFNVNVVLEEKGVGFEPTMANLTEAINIVSKDMIAVVSVVPRITAQSDDTTVEDQAATAGNENSFESQETSKDAESPDKTETTSDTGGNGEQSLADESETAETKANDTAITQELSKSTTPLGYYETISSNEDILKILVHILNGMSACANKLQKYLTCWDKYRHLWDTDKEAFIRRYAKANRPLEQYDMDITRYREQQSEVECEQLSNTINFVKIDCSKLKHALVQHCTQWQNMLTGLLNRNVSTTLSEIHEKLKANTITLTTPPLNLDELSDKIHLLTQLQESSEAEEERFAPIELGYQLLHKFDVNVSEVEVNLLHELRPSWANFQTKMVESNAMLAQSKLSMKKDLEAALSHLNGRVEKFREEVLQVLPCGNEYSLEDAFELLDECAEKSQSVRAQESRLKPGLEIFAIEFPDRKELNWTENETAVLRQIWTSTKEWNEQWKCWKDDKFDGLVLNDMELIAQQYNKKVSKLGREKGLNGVAAGAKKFGCYQALKELIDQFRQTLPLIQDLKNPAIRPRHWDQLKEEINQQFDPFADEFTLAQVFSLGLHMHGEFISEMSANANKELAIEQSLAEIEETWSTIDVEMTRYKDIYWKVKSTEDMFAQLEDNQVSLSTMKASKFYTSFQVKIEKWESTLSSVGEVVELLLQVQRQWMYLESIFMASEDIKKQLPMEAKLFAEVNSAYQGVTEGIVETPNAAVACTKPGVLDILNDMDTKLERIQKSLDQYLETKRQAFPRFYFLSNDDLLEILGQQKDPSQVQKHIKKCFVGVKLLELVAPGKQGNKTYEAKAMISNDGELVPFVRTCIVDGPVENWLNEVEACMFESVAKQCQLTLAAYRGKKEKWIKEWPGQLLITVGTITWTAECTKALEIIMKGNNKSALRQAKKKQIGYLNKLSDMVRGQLSKIERSKLVALITMEIHNRDVQDRMIKSNCQSVFDFDWLSQLRFYWIKDHGEHGGVHVRQTNQQIEYGYEYQGNNGRLVVTPLTDRCVLTLVTALALNRGGAPAGPAGTGKTETVKDLGKNLAKYVVVFNCSDAMDYKSVGRMFSGLVQTGGWGCFDEFNRIQIEVLSVIAQQVMSIMNAIAQRKRSFNFMGVEVRCRWSCGIFITMNPGYAGRTELPDNLASLFRPVSMMVPDLALIAEVMLAAEGFRDAKPLAKKTTTLYTLMIQQLSKQDHYDFGLRSLRGVLTCAGGLKRADASVSEELILLRALRDMNVPKFIREDMKLFMLLINDLFPGMETPPSEQGSLQVALEKQLSVKGLQPLPINIAKAVQLYESKLTRHCNMVVGKTLSGKSTCWKLLSDSITYLAKEEKHPDFTPVRQYILNPKSVSMNELYGAFDLATFEWSDGILSNVFRACAQDERPDEKWIVLDGPVDTLWIESMNTVMDDNKTLTLINGDRINMSSSMSLLFEVRDLAVASPATVSRAGMIYLDGDDLGWRPFATSWIQNRVTGTDPKASTLLQNLFDKYFDPVLKYKLRNTKDLVPMIDFHGVRSFCNLFDCLATEENGVSQNSGNEEEYNAMVEKWFVFCLVWSLCAVLDESSRPKMDAFLRDLDAQLPPAGTAYDYYVDVKGKEWKMWEEKVPSPWRPPTGMPFFKMIVPTVDTVRNTFVIQTLVERKYHTMIVGNTGTGKTVLVEQMMEELLGVEGSQHSKLVVNFSSATNSLTTQEIIEGAMEKRAKDKFGPTGGKQLICFVDDFNMPRKDLFGSQPPLELIRQWVDYGGWYERQKQSWRNILDMQLLVGMGPPGGGRSEITGRLQSRFNMVNFTAPSNATMSRIFNSILTPHLMEFEDDVRSMAKQISQGTVEVYTKACEEFLPTPEKCHYLFNLRDVAKVVQGVLQASRVTVETKEDTVRLWVHECSRVFCDRFISKADGVKFTELLTEQVESTFGCAWSSVMEEHVDPELGPVFCSFLTESDASGKVLYEEARDLDKLKAMLDEKLEDYNVEPGKVPMELVLFRDAMGHICRISRVLKQPRGNVMLVGIGGSGRQSLTKLASYTCELNVFQIEITKQYRAIEFKEDLKRLYQAAGCEDKSTVFLFNDTQIKEESFLEDINNILSSGEVPNLFSKEDKMGVFEAVRPAAKKAGITETADNLWEFFIQRTRSNLHIVLCMSPVGEGFRNRCRMYPALVNCTTIDFFHPWPKDALSEVAAKFLEDVNLGPKAVPEILKPKIGNAFAAVHLSVTEASVRMLLELKRHNYVTPTNYLELVKAYRQLMFEKLKEIGDSRSKLSGGLSKLEEGKQQVEVMSVELESKKIVVAEAQKECEELLVVIVSERRTADERKKQVEGQAERISKEEVECKQIADDAEADLSKALPALETAMEEVDKLDKSSISEVKAYASPPPAVAMVLEAVMILFGLKADWATAKKKIGESNFLQQIKSYNKDNVATKIMSQIKKYTKRDDFNAESVRTKSNAAAALCTWVLAIELYATVAKEVAPKRAKLKAAMDKLHAAQESLREAQEELAVVIAKVEELDAKYQESVGEKNRLRQEADDLELKLDRADKLVTGLSGERVRWEASILSFDQSIQELPGDALVAAAFLSYAGPFDSLYRENLMNTWFGTVKKEEIPFSSGFNFSTFLAKPTDVRNWNVAGLPSDAFSVENGVVTTRGRRWPLMIDPQNQANKWIKNANPDIVVCNLKMADYLRKLENAIQFGTPFLLQDVEEELDPAIEPVLNKSVVKVGNRSVIKLGDKEIDYSEDFRFYLTSKLGNPHYTPEVSTKVTLVNFAVKLQGLEAQLLGEVVKEEEPILEKQKAELVVKVAEGKNTLVALEDSILKMLAEAQGSLLDDEELVETLGRSKKTSAEVTRQLEVAEETEIRIDATRQGYRPVSTRAAILYFVLNDLSRVDPMYQFSLESYVDLFKSSILKSRKAGNSVPLPTHGGGDDDGDGSGASGGVGKSSGGAGGAASNGGADGNGGGNGSGDPEIPSELLSRITNINEFHMYAVYTYACRGLFERHKLLLSLQICFKKMQNENSIPKEELDFFLRGGLVFDRTEQRPNPSNDFVTEAQWDNVTELDKLSAFNGIASSFEQSPREWKKWCLSPSPETETLPGEWDNQLSPMQRMLVVRSLRMDRCLNTAANFVGQNLGTRFVEPPPFDLQGVFESSTPAAPLIFVLSPGVDPTKQVYNLAEQLGKKVGDCSLGQGQAPVATKLINEGLAQGNWVFLANCHLAASWLPALEKIIEDYCEEKSYHPDFRLWLSSSPTPKFPLTILQRGVKMTTEPPQGLRANLVRLYNLISEEDFERCEQKSKYKKLLFCLSWFHSLLLERRKFKALGWNIPYGFNDADFLICENIIAMYLDEYPEDTPWDAMRYLIAQANYGGRITDDWDRRLCNVYINQFFCEDALLVPNFTLCEVPGYYIPDDGDIKSYKDYIGGLPLTDHPSCFGQHPNADIASMMTNSQDVLDTVLSLQPRVVTSGGESNESKVLATAQDLRNRLCENFDMYEVRETLLSRTDPDPLKSVLMQELDRYNSLLSAIRESLIGLELGVQGIVVITAELEQVFYALLAGKVPEAWGFCYPSLKPLASWIRDLSARCQFFADWLNKGMPKAFWLSGFTYPTGFLTALLQTTARNNGLSIDSLSWEFAVVVDDASQVSQPPKEGAYINGIFLEGARWDSDNGCLVDANPLELISNMPVIHFKPVESKKKDKKKIYTCPLYLYPIRTGTRERPSFMIAVELKSGEQDGEFWTKRGCALLLSTAL